MDNHAVEEKPVDAGRVIYMDEKRRRVEIDISRFKLPLEQLEGGGIREDNVGLFFDRFMNSTFGSLEEPVEGGRKTELKTMDLHSAVGRYEIEGIGLTLFYEKIGKSHNSHVFSLLIHGKGEEELVERIVERVGKQKEIIEKTGRTYSVEDMMEIIEIDATDVVGDKRYRGEEWRDTGEITAEIHGEFIEKIFGDYERKRGQTGYGVLKEDYKLLMDEPNIATGWEVKDLRVDLVSRVGLNGTWVVHPLYVTITNKYPDNEKIFKIACERMRTLKGIMETSGRMEIPKELEDKYPAYNVQRLLPPQKQFGNGFRTRVAKRRSPKGRNRLKH